MPDDMTELQRQILITARNNPRATQSEIADLCDCSSSYVSNVLSRYDSVDAFAADLRGIQQAEPLQAATDFSEPPVWMEDVEPMYDQEEFDEAMEEGMQAIGQALKRGWKGLKVLIQKIRS